MAFTTAHWNGQTFSDLPAGSTVEEVRAALAQLYPQVANADYREVNGELYFEVRTGTKG